MTTFGDMTAGRPRPGHTRQPAWRQFLQALLVLLCLVPAWLFLAFVAALGAGIFCRVVLAGWQMAWQ